MRLLRRCRCRRRGRSRGLGGRGRRRGRTGRRGLRRGCLGHRLRGGTRDRSGCYLLRRCGSRRLAVLFLHGRARGSDSRCWGLRRRLCRGPGGRRPQRILRCRDRRWLGGGSRALLLFPLEALSPLLVISIIPISARRGRDGRRLPRRCGRRGRSGALLLLSLEALSPFLVVPIIPIPARRRGDGSRLPGGRGSRRYSGTLLLLRRDDGGRLAAGSDGGRRSGSLLLFPLSAILGIPVPAFAIIAGPVVGRRNGRGLARRGYGRGRGSLLLISLITAPLLGIAITLAILRRRTGDGLTSRGNRRDRRSVPLVATVAILRIAVVAIPITVLGVCRRGLTLLLLTGAFLEALLGFRRPSDGIDGSVAVAVASVKARANRRARSRGGGWRYALSLRVGLMEAFHTG